MTNSLLNDASMDGTTKHERRLPATPKRRCRGCGVRFSRMSLLVSLGLALLKIVVGSLAGSRALLASALYSINDMFSSGVVLVSLRVARRPADETHAYGYGSAEFIAMGLVSLFLAGGVVVVLILSVGAVAHGTSGPPHVSALLVALVVMAINYFLAEQGACASRHLVSPALQTSSEHYHLDATSSLAVAIGVSAALLGLHWVDALVAVFETVHVMWMAGTLLSRASRGLLDASLPAAASRRMREASSEVDGVVNVLELRTRRVGPKSWVDIVLAVPGNLNVQSADRIANDVREAVRRVSSQSTAVQVRVRATPPRRFLPVVVSGGRG